MDPYDQEKLIQLMQRHIRRSSLCYGRRKLTPGARLEFDELNSVLSAAVDALIEKPTDPCIQYDQEPSGENHVPEYLFKR